MTKPEAEEPSYRHVFYDPAALVANYLPSFPGGGLFLHHQKPFELWTRFRLTFNLPPDGGEITCRVEVLWANQPGPGISPGMGVRFLDLNSDDRLRLEEFLKRWARRDDILGGRYYRIFPPGAGRAGQSAQRG